MPTQPSTHCPCVATYEIQVICYDDCCCAMLLYTGDMREGHVLRGQAASQLHNISAASGLVACR